MTDDPQARFDAVLRAMANGESPSSARKKPSADQAFDGVGDACSSDTQTPPDASD